MLRRIVIITVAIIALVVVGVVALTLTVGNLTQPVVDATDGFFTAIKDNRLTEAYNMLSEPLQMEVDEETFNGTFKDSNLTEWSIDSKSVQSSGGSATGQTGGVATFGTEKVNFTLGFINLDNKWQLTSYEISPSQ